jgi:hypothetical protein
MIFCRADESSHILPASAAIITMPSAFVAAD